LAAHAEAAPQENHTITRFFTAKDSSQKCNQRLKGVSAAIKLGQESLPKGSGFSGFPLANRLKLSGQRSVFVEFAEAVGAVSEGVPAHHYATGYPVIRTAVKTVTALDATVSLAHRAAPSA
jgi:hypothetical protein